MAFALDNAETKTNVNSPYFLRAFIHFQLLFYLTGSIACLA